MPDAPVRTMGDMAGGTVNRTARREVEAVSKKLPDPLPQSSGHLREVSCDPVPLQDCDDIRKQELKRLGEAMKRQLGR